MAGIQNPGPGLIPGLALWSQVLLGHPGGSSESVQESASPASQMWSQHCAGLPQQCLKGDVVGQPGRTGEGDAPSWGGGEGRAREGVDGMFHLCCAAPAAPDTAHHPANHGFSPRTSQVGPLPQGGHMALRLLQSRQDEDTG